MPATEHLRHLALDFFEKVTTLGYDLEVMNPEYLSVLNTNARDPAVLFFNHTKQDDPLFAYHLVHKYGRERLNNIIMPVSEEYVHFSNFARYAIVVSLARKIAGFKMPEVVQAYRTRQENADENTINETQDKSQTLSRELHTFLKQELPGGPVIIISPEGHRHERETLLPAEKGIGMLAKQMSILKGRGEIDEGFFIPFGIMIEDSKGIDLYYNPIKKPESKLIIGEPIKLNSLFSGVSHISSGRIPRAEQISHYLMAQLGGLLPDEMKGVYHPNLLEDTFAGRFEQRTNNDGKVAVYDTWARRFLGAQDTP